MSNNSQNNKNTKEDFCAPCAALIPAAIGIGGASVSGTSGEKNKKIKKIIFYSSIGLTIISIIVFIWLKTRCTTCR
jgi:hypothetical protein